MAKYETTRGLPTVNDEYVQLIECLRKGQEHSAMLGHLLKMQGDDLTGQGWLAVSEMLKMTQINVTKLATKRLGTSVGWRQ